MSNIEFPKPIHVEKRRFRREEFRLVELGFFASYACNLKCAYCPHMGVYKKPSNLTLDLDLVEQKLPQFINKYADPLIPIGVSVSGGEPLLDWKSFERLTLIINNIKQPIKGKQITTNLALPLSVEQINFIARNYNSIHVSLDGKRETQDLRSKDIYNTVMKNLITLKSVAPYVLPPPSVNISITITEQNISHLYENIKFFIKNEWNITGGLDTTSQAIDPNMTEDRLKNFAIEFFKQIDKTRKDFDWPKNSLKELILSCNRNFAYTTANILPDGKIYRCPISPMNPIASLHDEDVIVNYDNLESFTENGLSYNSCKDCELNGVCNYCYAAACSNKEFYCGMMRSIYKLDEKYFGKGITNECNCKEM